MTLSRHWLHHFAHSTLSRYSCGVTTGLPEAAKPDHLTDALRRHGVLSTGRVRDVTTDAPRDLLMSRIVRIKLAYDGPAEKAPASLILKTWGPRDGVPEAWSAREVPSAIAAWVWAEPCSAAATLGDIRNRTG